MLGQWTLCSVSAEHAHVLVEVLPLTEVKVGIVYICYFRYQDKLESSPATVCFVLMFEGCG